MARNLEVVQSVCELSKEQEEILTGHQKPILLLVRKEIETKQLCSSVAPGNPKSRSDASICAGAVASISISGWNQNAGLSRNDQWKCIRCANLQIG